ncbi:MAG: hypothetical protein PWP23_11 [Candidatus Sumerlaeota bacterium]|nr:hypothetical protein [Candidatus Sumerlaeota bacterium]
MPEFIQTIIVLTVAVGAALFVLWKVTASFRARESGCGGCGSSKRCGTSPVKDAPPRK